MSWYRSDQIIDSNILEVILGEGYSDEARDDYLKEEAESLKKNKHLQNKGHDGLILRPFAFKAPIPKIVSESARFKPEGTYTSGIYIGDSKLTAVKERAYHLARSNSDFSVKIYTFSVFFKDDAVKNPFMVKSRTTSEQKILNDNSYEKCNILFKKLAINGKDNIPDFNLVEYDSLRQLGSINNLVYEIDLLDEAISALTEYRVGKNGNSISIKDARDALIEKYDLSFMC